MLVLNFNNRLDGRVNTNRKNGLLSSLEFDGTVMAFSPRRDGAWGYGSAHHYFKDEKVVASAKLMAQELAGENYEISNRLFDDDSIVIKKVGTHEELKKEIEEIRKVLTPSEEHSTICI